MDSYQRVSRLDKNSSTSIAFLCHSYNFQFLIFITQLTLNTLSGATVECKPANELIFSIQLVLKPPKGLLAYFSFSLTSCSLPLHPFHSSPYPSSFPTFYLLSSPFSFPPSLFPYQQNQRMMTPRAASDTNSSPPPSGYIHFQNPLNCACV